MSAIEDEVDCVVVVPTYRRPDVVVRCLGALMSQDVAFAGVVIAAREDDAETISRLAELGSEEFRFQLVTTGEPGVIAAMSAGVAASRAKLVAFADDDAVPPTDWLRRITSLFSDERVGGAGGRDRVPGNIPADKDTVGVFRRCGRLVGNHHLGRGPARDVDVLKGVNMAYRSEALSMPLPGVLRGEGAQVFFEVLVASAASSRGWRLVYDPSVIIEHLAAERSTGGDRAIPSRSEVFDAAYNSVRCLELYPVRQRLTRCCYALLVGTPKLPGALRPLLPAARRSASSTRRARWALSGRLAALADSSRRGPVVITAAELREKAAIGARNPEEHPLC